MAVQVAQGQNLDVTESLVPKVSCNAAYHAVVNLIEQPLSKSRNTRAKSDPSQTLPHPGKIHISGGYNAVNGTANQDGDI